MTAFASAESSGPEGALVCEVRTVNHRYLEQSLRLPEELRGFEPLLREAVAARLSRGKVDLTIRLRAEVSAKQGLHLNKERVEDLMQAALEIDGQRPGLIRVEFTDLLRYPGVVEQAETDPEAMQAALTVVLGQALDALTATREREGAKLAELLRERLDAMVGIVANLREWMPDIRRTLRARLESRLGEIKQPVDPGRLEQELVMQITRIDVDEELDRLDSHISEARRVLGLAEPVGRRLDFLMQEFNREANTLGSKSVDARSTNAAVELKVLIEQMREQVQNIE